MPLQRKTFIPSFLLLAAMVVLLFCGKDYNPFTDLTNAKVHVFSGDISDGDTVPLYATKTLNLVVALYEEVDSFVIKIPGNRYWADTVLGEGRSTLGGGPYSFSVSFNDTGLQEILLETHRSNGEAVPEILKVHVTNPLRPFSVDAFFGKRVALFTPRVADNDAVYHWYFGPGRKDSSLANTFSRLFYYFRPCSGTGNLWVTDLAGKNSTPPVTFSYSFKDTSPPIITNTNIGSWRGDTLETGDTTLLFKARIVDSGTSEIDYCSINGSPFETAPSRDNVYSKIFENLPVLTRGDIPLRVSVFARDNPDSPSNVSTRSFWLLFKSGAGINPLLEITILVPSSQNTVSSKRNLNVTGTIKSYFAKPRALDLRMRVNGSLESGIKSYPDSSFHGSPVYWTWPVYLDNSMNTVTAILKTADGDSATASTVVLYDPNAIDAIRPVIYEVTDSADGTRLDNNKDSNTVVYTTKPEMTLRIIAFDDGSGIQSITLNGAPLQSSTQMDYLWYAKTGPLVHSVKGTRHHIRVTDNANNVSEKTLTIIKNTPPKLEVIPDIPRVFYIDSTYLFQVSVSDDDKDTVSVLWHAKPDSMITATNGKIAWRPGPGDLHPDSLVIQASDGFELSKRFIWRFEAIDRNVLHPAHFLTTEQDFPVVLQAGRDTLSVQLETDTVFQALRYSAWFLDRNQTISQSSSSANLVWPPVLADTGYRRLMVTVGNGITAFDTITPVFRVVRRNEYPCSLSYLFKGDITSFGELDLFTHPAAETLFFAIHDQDDPVTEKYTVSITQKNINSVQVIDKGNFFIVVGPDTARILDTLLVSVLDSTGTEDSARIIIRYSLGIQYPCSLSYAYTGAVVSQGVVRRVVRAVPDTVRYTIIDNNAPVTEGYVVSVTRNGGSVPSFPDTLLTGQRTFVLPLNQSALAPADTFVTTIRNQWVNSHTSTLVVQYIPPTPYLIPGTTVYLSGSAGVTTTGANLVTGWRDTSPGGMTLSQGTPTDRPTLVSTAVNGEPAIRFVRDWVNHATDDALVCGSCADWDDMPFTIFAVFLLDSMSDSRQTLVSSTNDKSFGLGITCSGKLGMFNDALQNSCPPTTTISSDLAVLPHKWYVATYQSLNGIVNSVIVMDIWKNGEKANQTLTMNGAKHGSKLMIGAGRDGFNQGSLHGSIASVVVFNRALTDVERQAVERALGTKYKISVP